MQTKNNSIRLKQNESFTLRTNWLIKGINIVHDDPLCFKADRAVSSFGIGSNMVKSLRYYLTTLDLIEVLDRKNFSLKLSDLGETIYNNDRFLTDNFFIYILHFKFLQNKLNAAVAFSYFNNSNLDIASSDSIYATIKRYLESDGNLVNEKLLISDIQVLLRSYLKRDLDLNPEDDTYSSIFSHLNLIKKEGNIYKKIQADLNDLDPRVIFYCLEENFNEEFSIDDIIKKESSICQAFNLSYQSLIYYIKKLDSLKYLEFDSTAMLNSIKIKNKISLEELFLDYKRSRRDSLNGEIVANV